MANRILFTVAVLLLAAQVEAQDRETKVRNDKKNVEADESWVYNDLDRGIAEAKRTGKPMLVIFRCIPCEACSKFDDQVVRRDPQVRDLMDQFVCVRLVQANGMDLSQFQFDYDQSFHAFFMNPDKTIYGRFGTRSHRKDETLDMNLEGFSKALSAALALHKQYPANKALFAAKQGRPVEVKTPEDFPSLAGKYTSKLNYEGNVVKSCIHCHQVREAQRLVYRSKGQRIPDQVLFPYPLPDVVGLLMDSSEAARIKEIIPGRQAEEAGLRAGDLITTIDGQPILSIADLQWVLHNAPDNATLQMTVDRNGSVQVIPLVLKEGWRGTSDISWRPTTWDLRRMASGGLVLESVPFADRKSRGLMENRLALEVKYVGQYNEHAVGKNAGFQKGDVIVAVDGQTGPLTETGFIAHVTSHTKPGDRLKFNVLRGDKPLELSFAVQ